MIINESTIQDIKKVMDQSGISFEHGDVMDWSSKNGVYTFEFGAETPFSRVNKAKDAILKKYPNYKVNLTKKRYGDFDFYTLVVDENPSLSTLSGWHIEAYNSGNRKSAKIIKCSSKYDAISKRQSLLNKYDNVYVFDGEDYIDPTELI